MGKWIPDSSLQHRTKFNKAEYSYLPGQWLPGGEFPLSIPFVGLVGIRVGVTTLPLILASGKKSVHIQLKIIEKEN